MRQLTYTPPSAAKKTSLLIYPHSIHNTITTSAPPLAPPPLPIQLSAVHHGSPESNSETPVRAASFQRGHNGQIWCGGRDARDRFSDRYVYDFDGVSLFIHAESTILLLLGNVL